MNSYKTLKLQTSFVVIFLLSGWQTHLLSQATIIDHTSTDITRISESAIIKTKANLHIAYGHTSHGSQLIDGMTGLVTFANNGGLGLSHPQDIFAWNNGGSDGALDLHDLAMGGDVGYYPAWVNNTRAYLGSPDPLTGRGTENPDVNVILWSWCGQVEEKYNDGTLYSEYLDPMSLLEQDYPGVIFVYMTGHVNIWDDADNKVANQVIIDHCLTYKKVLYDFADIEHYDPDNTYFEYVNDNCDYYSESIQLLGNWATEWQESHIENVDWYSCGSAHSQPLNANQKAYAAWWMFAKLAIYADTPLPVEIISYDAVRNKRGITINWCTASEFGCLGFHIWRKSENDDHFSRITGDADLILSHGNSSAGNKYSFIDTRVKDFNSYTYKIEELTLNGESNFLDLIVVDKIISSFDLKKIYPNPFNPVTTIEYQLQKSSHIDLGIYNVHGHKVATLVSKTQKAGTFKIEWDASEYASGMYFCLLKTDNVFIQTKKIILLK